MPSPSLLRHLKERKLVEKLTNTMRSGHVHISLATGISIIVMAYASSRILPEPMPYLYLAAPPFLMTIYEALVSKKKYERYTKSLYWVVGIFATTLIVIGASLV
jgi:hypothetical protein